VKKPVYVLDSYALLAFFQAEPGGVKVKDLLKEAEMGDAVLFLSPLNLGEIYYTVARKLGMQIAERIIEDIRRLPISMVDATWERILDAARIKAKYPLSYADAFAAALAHEINATMVTGDPEFRRVEFPSPVLWL